MDNVLVTGGAGQIGSHACRQISAAGPLPVAVDHLGTGWRDVVKFGPLVEDGLPDLAKRAAGCKPMVFSATCAPDGDRHRVLLDATTRPQPLNADGGGTCPRAVDVPGRRTERSTLRQMTGDAWRWHRTGDDRG